MSEAKEITHPLPEDERDVKRQKISPDSETQESPKPEDSTAVPEDTGNEPPVVETSTTETEKETEVPETQSEQAVSNTDVTDDVPVTTKESIEKEPTTENGGPVDKDAGNNQQSETEQPETEEKETEKKETGEEVNTSEKEPIATNSSSEKELNESNDSKDSKAEETSGEKDKPESKTNEESDEFDVSKLRSLSTKEQIEETIKLIFPNRKHLGSLVYNPTTTWLTLQTSHLTGLKDEHFQKFEELRELYREKLKEEYYAKSVKYIPVIPPLPTDYINYLLEVKIPYRFIKAFKEDLESGVVSRKREIWGGKLGMYTDDSDILTVLAHLGFFNDKSDLSEWNSSWKPEDVIYPEVNKESDIKGDLSVTLLLLPTLSKYLSVFKNGINSREWKQLNKHDGLSFAVYNIKWEMEGTYLRDKSFFKRYQTEVVYDLKYLKQQVESREGWTFDAKYYKELKAKYEKEEQEKKQEAAN